MAVIKAIPTKQTANLGKAIKYINNPKKTDQLGLVSGKDTSCDPRVALAQMQMTKEMFDKTEGSQYKHFVQSFSPTDTLDPVKAHELGMEWAKKSFPGFEVMMATHIDKNHLHNHFIVNSVNFENGLKFHEGNAELQKMKDLNDQICERERLHVIKEKTPGKWIDMNEYQVAIKGESWKFKMMATIDQALERTQNKAEFIKAMEDKGYKVTWNHRKHITYTTPEGDKVRDNKLHDPKYMKEAMDKKFQPSKTQTSEPTSKIVQQPRTLKQVKQEIELTRAEVNKAYEKMYNQTQIVGNLETKLKNAKSDLEKYDQLTVKIGKVESELGGINRFNLLRRTDIKDLKNERDGYVSQKQISFGSSDREELTHKLRKLEQRVQPENKKLNELENRFKQSTRKFNELTTEAKSLEKNNTMGKSRATGQPVHDTIKALGNSLEKVQQKEKVEGERIKQKIEQQSQNPRSKRSQEEELER